VATCIHAVGLLKKDWVLGEFSIAEYVLIIKRSKLWILQIPEQGKMIPQSMENWGVQGDGASFASESTHHLMTHHLMTTILEAIIYRRDCWVSGLAHGCKTFLFFDPLFFIQGVHLPRAPTDSCPMHSGRGGGVTGNRRMAWASLSNPPPMQPIC